MTRQNKLSYYRAIVKRYHSSGKRKKGLILDEFCEVCGYQRSYAIRLLNWGHRKRRKKPGRKSTYAQDREFMLTLRRVWSWAGFPCGRLLQRDMAKYLPHYAKHFTEPITAEVREKLQRISSSTIDRLLRKLRARYGRGRSLTKPGSLIREEIPIRATYFDEMVPGFVEADTVAHCGDSGKGPFILTLTLTDINTAWTESRAIWTKAATEVVAAIKDIESCLPFPIQGFDCDNGSEFLNDHLVRYFQGKRIPLTRSRPYRKNDNAHVEQKNWMHARQALGYGRLENPDLVPIINDMYRNEWSLFHNCFRSTMKLKNKILCGSKYKRIYDEPKTPLERVLESPLVDEKKKQELKSLYETLDPFQLKKDMLKKQQYIKKLAKMTFADWQLMNAPTALEQ